LPEPLSARICSLVPEEDRLAMVARIDLDRHAQIVDTEFSAAVIHSRARFDYPGVAAALGGDTRGKRRKYEPFLPALRAMDSLARQMRVARIARGALDFDLPEPFIELDHDDPRLVRAIKKSTRATRTRSGGSTTRPIAGGSKSSRCWPRTTASRSTSTPRARRWASRRCWTG
jgi:exoribonuclease R